MRNTTGTRPFTDTTWFAVNKTVVRYTRKDSVGSIVRSFPNGRRRKPPIIRVSVSPGWTVFTRILY